MSGFGAMLVTQENSTSLKPIHNLNTVKDLRRARNSFCQPVSLEQEQEWKDFAPQWRYDGCSLIQAPKAGVQLANCRVVRLPGLLLHINRFHQGHTLPRSLLC